MSFLAPLFLLGAVAIGLPIVFHLIRRSSKERVPFSSLMFLLPTPPRVTRRSKLENVVLLLLRCAVIALLAFAFARPFLSRPVTPDPAGRSGQRVILLVDTSASMRRAGLWSQAKAKAQSVLQRASPADQVGCYTFDRQLTPLVSFDQWAAVPAAQRAVLTSKRLDEVSPGWGSTRLGPALLGACELFEDRGKQEGPKRIVLITDLQEGSRLDGLQGFEWPKGITVSIEPVLAERPSNAGLQLAVERDDLAAPVKDLAPRVRVSNASDSKREQFQIGWKGAGASGLNGPTLDCYIPPGQSRSVSVPRPSGETQADRIALTGDDDDFDNTLYVLPAKTEATKIVVIGGSSETDSTHPVYYLRRAFQDTRALTAELVVKQPDALLDQPALAQARLLVITDPPSEEQIQAVQRFLQEGKAVLMPLATIQLMPALGQVLGQPALKAQEASGSYAMLSQINFEHPLFVPFADPRYSDFTKIHFWKHRRLDVDAVPGSRVLARFDNEDPALIEFTVGPGRLWVLTSGWQPADSQLALSSKFVPLLYAMLGQSGAIRHQEAQFLVGDPVPLPEGNQPVTIRKPDTSEVTVKSGERFTGTDQPGIYSVTSIQPPVTFAVNLPAEESRTAPLHVEELERLGVPLREPEKDPPRNLQQRKEHLQAVQLENRQKLWRWLIVAALVVLVVETWLAGRLTRRPAVVIPEPG
jgi:hypothetical protein